MDLLIRFAKMEDAEELLALYTPYVTDTVITFEYEVPSLEEFKDRMRQTMRKYPVRNLSAIWRWLLLQATYPV